MQNADAAGRRRLVCILHCAFCIVHCAIAAHAQTPPAISEIVIEQEGRTVTDPVITALIETRVGAPVAVTCYVDHTPPPVVTEVRPGIMAIRGEGRPSKRLRRELERLRRAAER